MFCLKTTHENFVNDDVDAVDVIDDDFANNENDDNAINYDYDIDDVYANDENDDNTNNDDVAVT